MHKLAFCGLALAMLLLPGSAGAGSADDSANRAAINGKIERTGCLAGDSQCAWGRKRVCGPGYCWCAPCGGLWRLWHRQST